MYSFQKHAWPLQPLRVPGFAFAWLDLISHRNLMPKLLLAPSHKGWPNFQRLLLALLRFLEPYLRNAELTDAVRLLYKVSHYFHRHPLSSVVCSLSLLHAVGSKYMLHALAIREPWSVADILMAVLSLPPDSM